ncbi:MAG TPA: CheR family methyltransferase [Thermoanaerobaculia bacterium]|nr:CheR family methyltransferase [Thermoanaerobaculia bacterium]
MAGTGNDVSQVFPIVGVGASAGGIEAFTELMRNIPENPGMAFVFVLHQDPKHESNLVHVIARSTRLPVETARDRMRVESNHVYVLPPNAEADMENGTLRIHQRGSGTGIIDHFFRSLAEDQGPRAIAVVLSGSASDGALGVKEIKAEGGITFAQDRSAKMDSMPQAAIAGSFVDFVLSPSQVAEELLRIARNDYLRESRAHLPEQELMKLFTLIHARHDIDFTHYKPTTIERRIRRRMALRKANTLEKYLQIVNDDPTEIENLYSDILIKVTEFFRDPDVFRALELEVFPELMRERKDDSIRAWVPGCATGEEVYSLAISMLESASTGSWSCPIQIFGTDVSESAIERARVGLYPESIVAEVSPDRLRRFFSKVEGGYRISKSVRDCCIFARQNVTKDPPFSKLDLISCRNVMIYFGTALQRKVISIFNYALRPDGFLLLGSSETIGNFGDLFGVVDRKHKIYRKQTAVARPAMHFDMVRPPQAPERENAEPEGLAPNAVFREADRVLLNRYTPSGVLINENLDVLQFRGRTSRYLELPPGTASFNLLKMAREGLLADLRTAIHTARKKDAPERREGIRVKFDDHTIVINLEVIPFVGASKERFLLVLFEEVEAEKKGRVSKKKKEEPEPSSKQNERLKRELEATREYLQSIIEEQEAMNEELRSANEEIQSSNEELQSTNEELETAKEELQSSNEELTTLNEELENRNQELATANNDLVNLLSSIDIPVVMLDSGLRIRRFNPGAQRMLNLIPSDIGRPIADMKTSLQLDNLDSIVSEVIEKLETRELYVEDRSGRRQFLRIRPYKTTDNKIDGAVLVLIDVDELQRMQPRGTA